MTLSEKTNGLLLLFGQPQPFTHRKKELVDFDASESGMTAYFCARYENQKGEHGAWGTVVLAVIP
jgi:hypothetical protein